LKIGQELIFERDTQIDEYFLQALPRVWKEPSTSIALACVSIDGGRMQTRKEGGGLGVHEPHWRETKNALFMRMSGVGFSVDPHESLPACFSDRKSMKSLLPGAQEEQSAEEAQSSLDNSALTDSWRPERLFRTCISSLCDSDAFGRMMQFEADSRGFYSADKKAFVSDGLPYNWTIQKRHFSGFTPILDFVHAVEKLYAASRCVNDEAEAWDEYVRWADACWRGNVSGVISDLRQHQTRIGTPTPNCDKTDPRKILHDTIGYLSNNESRMNYPEYRQKGLPVTSAHMESLVKELNQRVKGTEKFWDDGVSGEAILQIRAAALCDDDRLPKFLANRPGHPFHPNVPKLPPLSAAA
jgi:hypothetical protein